MAGVIRISGKRSKFRNKRCRADGFTFDSLKERERYYVLRALAAAGKIQAMLVHPRYPLLVYPKEIIPSQNAMPVIIGKYVADFSYFSPAGLVVEDVKGGGKKGTRTELYRWKKKHFEVQYRIKITEV